MPSTKPPTIIISPSKVSQLLLLLLLLLLTSSTPVKAISFQQCRTLISLSHSLMNRVAQLRTSRGDLEGSQRARTIAAKLEGGVGLLGSTWAVGWDYLRNYAWRDMPSAELFRMVSDLNRILKSLNELTRLKSADERTTWVWRNYQKVLGDCRSLFKRLLRVFFRSGPLRDLVLAVQREVQGNLLRDCLELGSNDLKGLLQVVKDLAGQFPGGTNGRSGDL